LYLAVVGGDLLKKAVKLAVVTQKLAVNGRPLPLKTVNLGTLTLKTTFLACF
jgi:hypothetical protein